MKKHFVLWCLILALLFLTACNFTELTQPPVFETETQQPTSTNIPETQNTEPTQTNAPEPQHSVLYLPEVSVEQVIGYFNEVCLDSEFVNSGDPSVIQKWTTPIRYTIEGSYTQEDIATLRNFESFLNDIEGFPGISQTDDPADGNMRICFGDKQNMLDLLGPNFANMDGGVTFWYSGTNKIYNAIICYRTDIDQTTRNSVILEEIYNGLGPVQDTERTDSIIYTGFSTPQWLTDVDILILQLLYHPDIRPGMNAQQCEQVIRNLYH